jgi:hypothetical protein
LHQVLPHDRRRRVDHKARFEIGVLGGDPHPLRLATPVRNRGKVLNDTGDLIVRLGMGGQRELRRRLRQTGIGEEYALGPPDSMIETSP